MTEKSLLQAALDYAACGLSVFPLKPGAKSPALKGWQESSTTDAAAIKAWWTQNPNYNIGIDCGKSGLVVIDYDAANGKQGLTIREDWRKSHAMPETWVCRTPRGGLHEYYRGTGGTKTGLYPGVDIRGVGGLVAAPPSVFDGKRYEWEQAPGLYPLAIADGTVCTFISPVPENFDRQQARGPRYTVPDTIPDGERTSAMIQLAGSLIGKGLSPTAAEAAIREENELRCNPPLTDEELQREVIPALHREKWQASTAPYTNDLPVNMRLVERLRALDPANNRRYGQDDAGAARLFVDTCGGCCKYAADRRKWLFYDGSRWDADGENAVREKLKELAAALTVYGLHNIPDEKRRAEFLKWAAKWQQFRQRDTILKDAASVNPTKFSSFDRDPLLLNCQNGTLDLSSFELKPHNAGDHLAHMANVKYDPTAQAPRWVQFIDEITAGDKQTAQYLQKVAGYCLTGQTHFECAFVCHGATARNGKSTLLETLKTMLGDYAASAAAATFAKHDKAKGSEASPDLARLLGVRFVIISEPPQGMEMDAARLKALTGNDSISARHLHEGFFEYVPVFKLVFNSNHTPRISDMSVFEGGRLRLIPFNVHFGEDRRDPTLKTAFKTPENLSGVLNWALEGLRLLRAEGFTMPPAVAAATNDYRRSQDKLLLFLEEETESGDGFEVPLVALHNAYGDWCRASGLQPCGLPRFRELLTERQIHTKKKRPAGTGRRGKPIMHALGLRLLVEK